MHNSKQSLIKMYQKLAIISTVATAQLNYNLAKCDANPITSHQYPVSNNDGAARVIPDNGVNGNWVVYGIPDSNSITGVSAAAPVDCTTNPATGAAYAFGNEVPISCCEAVDGTETQFYQRANAQTGYCSTLPQADAGLGTLSSGPYDGRYWTQFNGMVFCHNTNIAVVGEFCGNFDSTFENYVGNGCGTDSYGSTKCGTIF